MAEYLLVESVLNGEAAVRVYADDRDDLPTRVEIQGVAGRYRFILVSPDRTRTFTTSFDSPTTVSRNISNALARQYTPDWQIGVEGV